MEISINFLAHVILAVTIVIVFVMFQMKKVEDRTMLSVISVVIVLDQLNKLGYIYNNSPTEAYKTIKRVRFQD